MSETVKHTPGPWAVYAQPIASKADAILESIEQVEATENITGHIYLIDAGGKCAAIAGCGPTSEANARLIAASPGLLSASERIVEAKGMRPGHVAYLSRADIEAIAADALAKAGG